MNPSAKLWVGFRLFRVVAFVLSTLASMTLTVIFAILLLREWKFYSNAQRTITIMILVFDGFSTILLYLMIIVRFRLWLDGARVMFLVIFQGGATVTFSILNSSLPCNNLGTVENCKTVSTVATLTGWSLTGLLVFYAFCLAIMSHVPRPPPPVNAETTLVENQNEPGRNPVFSMGSSTSSKTWTLGSQTGDRKDERRHSLLSNSGSDYSQASWIGSPAMTPPMRSSSLRSQTTMLTEKYGVYRPDTPQVIFSPSASSISSSVYHNTTSSLHDQRSIPQPLRPSNIVFNSPTPPSPPKVRHPVLPNPFMEPLSRSGTLASVASFRSDGFLFAPPYFGRVRKSAGQNIPASLLAGGRPVPPPAYGSHPESLSLGSSRGGPDPPPPEQITFQRIHDNSTPIIFQAGATARDTHKSLKSPGEITVLSQSVSIQAPSRSTSLLSVPRSPSPHSLPSHVALPSSPMSLVLPTHPRLYPANFHGPQRFQEVRRFGSSSDLKFIGGN